MHAAPDMQLLRFNALRNALYHEARQLWLERINRLLNLLVIMLGAGAVMSVAESWLPVAWLGAAVSLAGALQLVFDFSGRACLHRHLRQRYYELLAEMDADPAPDDARRAHWWRQLGILAAQEPPTLKGLDALAYNDALDALEMAEQERLLVPWRVRLLAQFARFNGRRFAKQCEAAPTSTAMS